MADSTIRLDKFLANAGIISRRGVKQFLKSQNVTVNGTKVTESGTRLQPTDKVLINNKVVTQPGFVYYLLNKPIGIISTTSDEFGRDNVTSLIDTSYRVYPVGRLDKDTHGLVLLTNDGELTHKLIHPRYHVAKVYKLTLSGHPSEHQLEQFRRGVILDDGITLPAEVEVIKPDQTIILNKKNVIPDLIRDPELDSRLRGNDNAKSILQVTLHEGRNRQIRRMCEEVGLDLLDLQRIAFGPLSLGILKKGEYRQLTKKEIQSLKDAVKVH